MSSSTLMALDSFVVTWKKMDQVEWASCCVKRCVHSEKKKKVEDRGTGNPVSPLYSMITMEELVSILFFYQSISFHFGQWGSAFGYGSADSCRPYWNERERARGQMQSEPHHGFFFDSRLRNVVLNGRKGENLNRGWGGGGGCYLIRGRPRWRPSPKASCTETLGRSDSHRSRGRETVPNKGCDCPPIW